ncbi:MAG: C39 family peptidase, partial [Nocardioidaceae bacterium]
MTRHVRFTAFRSGPDFAAGTGQGVEVAGGRLRYGAPAGVGHHGGGADRRRGEWCAWLSPEVRPGFGFTSLVPSWNAETPGSSWVSVQARVSRDGARWSRWYSFGVWAEGDAEVRRSSVDGQSDGEADLSVDVLSAREDAAWSSYQLRVVLGRRPGDTAEPTVRLVAAMVSRLPERLGPPSVPGVAAGVELAVPAYSQQLHRGTYAQWGNGGESWCSPTSTAMVLDYWSRGPAPEECAWIPDTTPDRSVVHAVRGAFDYGYPGAGNWSFNAAYAATRPGVTAFVTRLRSLAEAEALVARGVPVIATLAFEEHELTGAGYQTSGHLLTITGFTERGDVVVNDPASHERPSDDDVRVVFDRAELERAWLGSAGGVGGGGAPPAAPPPGG